MASKVTKKKSPSSSRGASKKAAARKTLEGARPKKAAGVGIEGKVAGVFVTVMAFFTGASVMIVELAASRILAPHFGNTLYTWTGIIGIIMVALSVGYYAGGRLADKMPSPAVLLHLVAGAAVLVLLIPLLSETVISRLVTEDGDPQDLVMGPVWAAMGLFAIPGALLGTVTPFAIKLLSLASDNQKVGTSAGTISMVSTAGSVVGTFGTGFVLIPSMGIRTIFTVVGIVLAAFAALGYGGLLLRTRKIPAAAGTIISVGLLALLVSSSEEAWGRNVIYQSDTYYHQIKVLEYSGTRGSTVRELRLDNTAEGAQSDEGDLVYQYTRYYRLERLFCPQMRRAAFLGGGAYSMPQALVDDHPEMNVDVAEIDPALEEIGRRFFRLGDYEGRIHPSAGDARAFLYQSGERYDLIFGDAYRGRQNVPSHMVTREFFETVRDRLTDDGVYMMNLIGSIEGPQSRFFTSASATIREVFPELYVFATFPPEYVHVPQNLILVAPKRAREWDQEELVRRADGDIPLERMARTLVSPDDYDLSEGQVLTDDFNPVQYIIARQLNHDIEAF